MLLKAQHILVAHEYEAKDALKKLASGETFDQVAKDFSICPSSKQGGHLGEFPTGRMIPAFERELLKLNFEEISGIVRTQFGYHIIKRL